MEPIIKDPQGFDQEKLKQGMLKEMASMVNQGVFEEIALDQATEEEKRNIIGSKWVHRNKGDEVRSRIVGLGFDEIIKDSDDVYASALPRVIGKILEHQGRRHQRSISTCPSWSNNKHPTQTTSRVLHQQEHLLEIEKKQCMVSGHHQKPSRTI